MSGGPNPTIVFVTDFGLTGPYVGQMEAVIVSISPRARLINLLADAPVHNPRATAYLLAAYQQHFKAGTIFLCVVDPGVGTQQSLPVIVSAQDKWCQQSWRWNATKLAGDRFSTGQMVCRA